MIPRSNTNPQCRPTSLRHDAGSNPLIEMKPPAFINRSLGIGSPFNSCGKSPGPAPELCFTVEQVAEILGASARTVQRLIAAGKLRKLPLQRLVRIAPAELERLLAGKPIPTATE